MVKFVAHGNKGSMTLWWAQTHDLQASTNYMSDVLSGVYLTIIYMKTGNLPSFITLFSVVGVVTAANW